MNTPIAASAKLSHTPETPSHPLVRIRATRGWRAVNLAEFWQYRQLLWFLAGRDVKLRYKQTVLGVAWAVIQPLFTMIVFSLFFGKLGKLPSDGVPYPLLTMVALLPWQLFAYALTQSSGSLVNEQRLITKVYFPRLIVPVASVLAGLVDLAIAFLLTMIFVLGYVVTGHFHLVIGWQLLTVPFFVLFALFTALGAGLWLSALNVQFRDVRYILPFLTQIWLILTPVAYSSSIVPAKWRALYGLNPMAGVVEGFRWAILGSQSPAWGLVAVSGAVVLFMMVGGLFYFSRLERSFADVV